MPESENESESEAVALCRRYLETVARGGDLTELVDPDVVFEELPNRVTPQGARSDLAAMRRAAERGAKAMRAQTYEVQRAHAAGAGVVVLEVLWTGVLAVPYGTLAPGDALRAHCAMLFELRAGRIVRQRNYDCYEPF